jgi:hypothetical protein
MIVRDWYKSSLSVQNACVEIRVHETGAVDVRNSKKQDGPSVSFTKEEWAAFIGGARNGEFDV